MAAALLHLVLLVATPCYALSGRRTPVMGWSSWSVYACDVHEEGIKAQADAIVALGLRDAGYEYIDIDDCCTLQKFELPA